ncbi:MAG: hypothetical protein V3V00_16000 [Saprospiraceae bacterium]
MKNKLQTSNTKIEDREVLTTAYPARRGLKLKIKLSRLLIPFLDQDTDNLDLALISKTLTENLTEDKVEDLIFEILMSTHVDSKDVSDHTQFDVVFSADFGFLYKVLYYVLEVNYGSFLDMMGLTEKKKKDMKEKFRELTPASK